LFRTVAPYARPRPGTSRTRRLSWPFIPGTNGIESLNARFRAATRRRGHFPDEESALKVLYLAIMERRPNRANPNGVIAGWKSILNVLTMTYGDRLGIN